MSRHLVEILNNMRNEYYKAGEQKDEKRTWTFVISNSAFSFHIHCKSLHNVTSKISSLGVMIQPKNGTYCSLSLPCISLMLLNINSMYNLRILLVRCEVIKGAVSFLLEMNASENERDEEWEQQQCKKKSNKMTYSSIYQVSQNIKQIIHLFTYISIIFV